MACCAREANYDDPRQMGWKRILIVLGIEVTLRLFYAKKLTVTFWKKD